MCNVLAIVNIFSHPTNTQVILTWKCVCQNPHPFLDHLCQNHYPPEIYFYYFWCQIPVCVSWQTLSVKIPWVGSMPESGMCVSTDTQHQNLLGGFYVRIWYVCLDRHSASESPEWFPCQNLVCVSTDTHHQNPLDGSQGLCQSPLGCYRSLWIDLDWCTREIKHKHIESF